MKLGCLECNINSINSYDNMMGIKNDLRNSDLPISTTKNLNLYTSFICITSAHLTSTVPSMTIERVHLHQKRKKANSSTVQNTRILWRYLLFNNQQ